MTRRISISFSAVAGTTAGLGRAGTHVLIADRPDGVASGRGLGFNGGELMAAALGGCFWNDLHYVAAELGAPVHVDDIEAEVELAGTPPRILRAFVHVTLTGADAAVRKEVFDAACDASTIANSVMSAFPVRFELKEPSR
jgi:organic hydroperoxide reductase OsmC/OhrA